MVIIIYWWITILKRKSHSYTLSLTKSDSNLGRPKNNNYLVTVKVGRYLRKNISCKTLHPPTYWNPALTHSKQQKNYRKSITTTQPFPIKISINQSKKNTTKSTTKIQSILPCQNNTGEAIIYTLKQKQTLLVTLIDLTCCWELGKKVDRLIDSILALDCTHRDIRWDGVWFDIYQIWRWHSQYTSFLVLWIEYIVPSLSSKGPNRFASDAWLCIQIALIHQFFCPEFRQKWLEKPSLFLSGLDTSWTFQLAFCACWLRR